MNRTTLVFFLLVGGMANLAAQQLPLFTQYREYQSLLNPAAVESDFLTMEQNLNFGISYRAQWTEISGNPRTQVLRGSYLWKNMSGVALQAGGVVLNDQTGPTGMTGFYGRISGILTSDPEYAGFSLGLHLGMIQYRLNATKIRLRQSGDFLGDQNQSQWFPDVGVGLYFYRWLEGRRNGNFLYGGVSVPQVLGLDFTFQNPNGEFSIQRVPHFYANLGLISFLTDESFLEPTVWLRYVPNTPFSVDLNLRYRLPTVVWLGIGGGTQGNMHLEAGVVLGDRTGLTNSFKIGYGFDYTFSSFGPFTGPAHEVNLSFSFDK